MFRLLSSLTILAVVAVVMTGSGLAATVTPFAGDTVLGTTTFGGHTYALIQGDSDQFWATFNTRAGLTGIDIPGMDAHLATITSQGEDDALMALLTALQIDVAIIGGFQSSNAGDPDDFWEWVTGETWDFTNWRAGEPNDFPGSGVEDGEEDFLLLRSGGWNDIGGEDGRSYYIVEFEPEAKSTPEPVSLLLLGTGLLGLGVLRKRS